MNEKVAHVRAEMAKPQTRDHHCHWTGCTRQVHPAQWGCKAHWFMLPPTLRRKIWAAYKPGQERTQTPSAEYIKVAREVQEWIAMNGGHVK